MGKKEPKEDFDDLAKSFEKELATLGNLINAILDYVNSIKREKDEDTEEETFGYGRYNFDTILHLAKTRPDAFKKFK